VTAAFANQQAPAVSLSDCMKLSISRVPRPGSLKLHEFENSGPSPRF